MRQNSPWQFWRARQDFAKQKLKKLKEGTMRKIVSLLLIGFFVAMCSMAYAHPPQDITITYDAKTKMLTAVILHNVSNPTHHYIAKVSVGLNHQEIVVQGLSCQDDNSGQTVMYHVPGIKSGDTLWVEAYCSISGKLKKEIKITE
jgi:hypothetical protein